MECEKAASKGQPFFMVEPTVYNLLDVVFEILKQSIGNETCMDSDTINNKKTLYDD